MRCPKPTIGAGSENGLKNSALAADCGTICCCCKWANKIRNETSHLISGLEYRSSACRRSPARSFARLASQRSRPRRRSPSGLLFGISMTSTKATTLPGSETSARSFCPGCRKKSSGKSTISRIRPAQPARSNPLMTSAVSGYRPSCWLRNIESACVPITSVRAPSLASACH